MPIPFERAFLSDLSVSPDGTTLGRASYGGGPLQVSFYDTGTLTRTGSIAVPGDFSGELVFSPAGQCAVVGSSGNPVNRGGGITAIEIPSFEQRACSLIDLADNLAISSGNEIYVASGTRSGIDVVGLQPCGKLQRRRTYFLGIDTFRVGAGMGSPVDDDIRRIVLRDLPALSVEVAGTGWGTVTSAPAGISCGADCTEGYPPGTQVALTATPAPGSVFRGWSGACSGSGSCTVTLDAAKTVTATFATGRQFFTVTPCRALDTRSGAPLTSGQPRTFAVGGACSVPPTARAVSVNLTVVGPTGSGFVTLYPGGAQVPLVSAVNFGAAQTRSNNAILPLAASGDGTLGAVAAVQGQGSVHLVVDVDGYFE